MSKNCERPNEQDAYLEEFVAKLNALRKLRETGVFGEQQGDGYSRIFDQAQDIGSLPVTVFDMKLLTPELKALLIGYLKDKHDRAQAMAQLMKLLPDIKFDIEALERGAFPSGNA